MSMDALTVLEFSSFLENDKKILWISSLNFNLSQLDWAVVLWWQNWRSPLKTRKHEAPHCERKPLCLFCSAKGGWVHLTINGKYLKVSVLHSTFPSLFWYMFSKMPKRNKSSITKIDLKSDLKLSFPFISELKLHILLLIAKYDSEGNSYRTSKIYLGTWQEGIAYDPLTSYMIFAESTYGILNTKRKLYISRGDYKRSMLCQTRL